MDKNNTGKISENQKNFVPLQQENKNNYDYGTEHHGRAEAIAPADNTGERHERLGLCAVRERGRPTLGNRWDTLVYEEGLQPQQSHDLLGSSRLATQRESDRLIEVAKKAGDYIPSTIWESYGSRNKKPSGESVVFLDEKNNRVVKFKDPFAYISLKNDNPYCSLFEHHIHNYFFNDASYRLLGVSQDPVNRGVRFVFEQPFIKTYINPSQDEIKKWFKERGFELTKDGFWYTDGNVSFTDVWGDNCIKDKDGNFHFIDPIIKFEKEPKEVIAYYIERERKLQEKLDTAGVEVASRFRIDRMCSFNDLQVKDINLAHGLITFNHMTTHPDYQYDVTWPIDRFLDNIKLSQGSRWIMTDENRKDIVIPEAIKAVLERAKDPSPHAAFTDMQVKALNRFTTLYSEDNSKEHIFNGLLQWMHDDFKKEGICKEWIDDVKEELTELAKGERRELSEGLRR